MVRPGTERYGRCVGKPQPFAEIILVDRQTGQEVGVGEVGVGEVGVGEVGMVTMKSPTLALGYWNDSASTFRTRLNGYYLTGDAVPDRDREAEVRAALGEVAAGLLLRVVVVSESEIVLGPTGRSASSSCASGCWPAQTRPDDEGELADA